MATNEPPPPPPAPSGPPDLIGTVLAGRYRILKKLGQGGMGMVYLGEHVTMGRKTAIKVLHAGSTDADSVARFTRGSRNAARIDHENVCRIFDFGDPPGGLHFLAMEFVEGESLYDVLRREKRFPLERAADIVHQAAKALQAAHDLGIVHRDLKPANIMLTRTSSGRELVKVVDFDIAKGPSEDGAPELTQLNWVIGTPEYMSPEQFMAHPLDGRSDIYSLGLILFRVITGGQAFSAATPPEMMIERVSTNPKQLADVAPDVHIPPVLQAVISKALAQGKEERWARADEFGAAVLAAVKGESVPSAVSFAVPSSGSTATTILQGSPALAEALVPATEAARSAAQSTVAVQSPQPTANDVGTPPHGRPAGRSKATWLVGGALVVLVGGAWGVSQLMSTEEPTLPPANEMANNTPASETPETENPSDDDPIGLDSAQTPGDSSAAIQTDPAPSDPPSTEVESANNSSGEQEREPPAPVEEPSPRLTLASVAAQMETDWVDVREMQRLGQLTRETANDFAQRARAVTQNVQDPHVRGRAYAIRAILANLDGRRSDAIEFMEEATRLDPDEGAYSRRLAQYRGG